MNVTKTRLVVGAVTLFSSVLLAQAYSQQPVAVNAATVPVNALKVSSSINRQIASGKYNTPNVTTELHQFEIFPYTTPDKMPNGIVFHYTDNANNYSARSEADYEINGGWENAFVHTFIDHNTILNIHNTNYGAWGAGPYANHRFVQFELVTARNKTEFAQSINNAAWYTAYICHLYNLPLTLAGQHYGIGGIWTHHDVTKYLGGTDHTDPDAYLSKWHYTLGEFLDLVKAYSQTQHFPDTMRNQHNVDYTALISQNSRNDGMFNIAPYNVSGSSLAAYAKSYNGQSLQAVAEVTTQSGTWVKVKLPNGAQVWMDKRGIVKYDRIKSQKAVNYPIRVDQTGRNDMMFVNSPYGVLGAKQYQYAKTVNGQTFTAVQEAVVGDSNLTWVQVKLANGTLVWVDKRAVHAYDAISGQHAVAYDASISNVGKQDGLFKDGPYNVLGSSLYAMASQYRGQDVSVVAEAKAGSATWAQVRLANGQVVWLNKAVLYAYAAITNEQSVDYPATLSLAGANDGLFTNAPYGVKGSKLYAMANKYRNAVVSVKKTGAVGSEQWAYVTLNNGQSVWVSAKCLKKAPQLTVTNQAQYKAKIGTAKANDALFSNGPYATVNAKQYAPVAKYTGQQVEVLEEGTVSGASWLEVKLANGQIVWIDKRLITTYPKLVVTSTQASTAKIATVRANDGLFSNGPYNTADAKLWAMASRYQGQTVTVLQTGTVSGAEWAEVQLASGQKVWIDAGCLGAVTNLTITSTTQAAAKITAAANNDGLFTGNPYGVNGSSLYGYAKNYLNQSVTIIKEANAGSVKWAQIKLSNGTLVWIDKRLLTVDPGYTVLNNSQYTAQVNTASANDAIFANAPYGCPDAKNIGALRNYNGKAVAVQKEATAGKVHWVYVRFADGVQGWVDKSKLILQRTTANQTGALYATTIKSVGNGEQLYAQAGGQAIGSVGSYVGQRIAVLDMETVGNTYWAKVRLANGTVAWLHDDILAIGSGNNYGMNLSALSAAQRAFTLRVAQAAIKVGKMNGVYPSIIVAQAAGETGWGTSKLALQANNLFGIKADASWKGATYVVSSPEVENGKTVMQESTFRKYDSYESSVTDYALKLTGSNLYANAVRAKSTNAISACTDLSEWATDPNYVANLQKRITTYRMDAFRRIIR